PAPTSSSAASNLLVDWPRFHFSDSSPMRSGSAGTAGTASGPEASTGASEATRTTWGAATKYSAAATMEDFARFGIAGSSAWAARTTASSEPNWLISLAAVFSPMPATPGRPSDGSPRSTAISAYPAPARSTGTP